MTDRESQSYLSAALQASVPVGMQDDLNTLRHELYAPGNQFRVVLIKAKGGTGKTRLLEEMMAHVDHPNSEWHKEHIKPWPEATAEGATIVTDLIDVIDARLHDRNRFIATVYESLRNYRGVEFKQYQVESDSLRSMTASGAQANHMREAQDRAATAFAQDLKDVSQKRRVAIVVDTVERLSYELLDQLLDPEINLLEEKDLASRTHTWLSQLIRDAAVKDRSASPEENQILENVTLILAGRENEGRAFFTRIEEALPDENSQEGHQSHSTGANNTSKEEIELKRLEEGEIEYLFATLQDDWRRKAEDREANESDRTKANQIAKHFQFIRENRCAQLLEYTDGVPVRLMLYAQIVAEGRMPPTLLGMTIKDALNSAPDTAQTPDEKRFWVQWQIEDELIDLLFDRSPGNLRARVLLALLRAPRGLTAEQLEFVLYTHPDQPLKTWEPDEDRVKSILAELKEIEKTYLGKRRSSWAEFGWLLADSRHPEASTYRIGLQDEIYRVFGQHMGLFADPLGNDKETAIIRRLIRDEEKAKYVRRQQREQRERAHLYRQLSRWADWHYQRLLAQKRANQFADEQRFERELQLHNQKTFEFSELSTREVRERAGLNLAMVALEIERMMYDLLQDPASRFNTSYISLEDQKDVAIREEEDFWAQAEMWRTLSDDHLMKFVPITRSASAKERGEAGITVLRRLAQQENISRWIKRFALRDQAKEAIIFADAAEEIISDPVRLAKLTLEREEDPEAGSPEYIHNSWLHTVAAAERRIWKNYAAIRRSDIVAHPLEEIAEDLNLLEWYATNPVSKSRQVDGRKEYGFNAGVDKNGERLEPHPGFVRVKRLLSHGYNTRGYGYRVNGQMQESVKHYGYALHAIWDQKDLMLAHRALLLNNLARALSELGEASTEVCLDGLDLRRLITEEVPLASSYNTLALIYDDQGRYEDAPLLSAKAIAYCRRAGETRQLGLSLRQMAESLRHLAERIETGQRSALDVEYFFSAAETLLREARRYFSDPTYQRERLIEVELEFGSLYRDRMGARLRELGRRKEQAVDRDFETYYDEGVKLLESAALRAEASGGQDPLTQHKIDSYVNLARVHYLNHRYLRLLALDESSGIHEERPDLAEKVQEALDDANGLLARVREDADLMVGIDSRNKKINPYLITKERLPDPITLRDQNWIFRQMSTMQRIEGWQASDAFVQRINELKAKHGEEAYQHHVVSDDAVIDALKRLAEAYGLSIQYAELYSPRSRSAVSAQNDLYRRVFKFNEIEVGLLKEQLKNLDKQYGGQVFAFRMLQDDLTNWFGMSPSLSDLNGTTAK